MAWTREKEVRGSQESQRRVIPESIFGFTPNVRDVSQSYSRLPQDKLTYAHLEHHSAVTSLLWEAIAAYNTATQNPSLNEHDISEATDSLHRVINDARTLSFPAETLQSLSFGFIDTAFNTEYEIPTHVRQAIADMGTAIGGEDALVDAKVQRVAKHYFQNESASKKHNVEDTIGRSELAQTMFSNLGVVNVRNQPSQIDVLKGRAVKAALPSVATMLISASVFAPTAASATENTSTTQPEANRNTSTNPSELTMLPDSVVALNVAPKTEVQTATAVVATETPQSSTVTETVIESVSETAVTAPTELKPSVALPTVAERAPEPTTIESEVEEVAVTPVEASVNVAVSTETPVHQDPVTIITEEEKIEAAPVSAQVITNLDTPAQAESTITIETVEETPEVTPIDVAGDMFVAVDENGDLVKQENSEALISTQNETPKLDKETATKEQLAIETITESIVEDGDVASASALLQFYFHDQSIPATSFQNGKPVYETTNPDLVKNSVDLEIAFNNLIKGKGHTDANYVNTTLTALAVLNALANDQSILNSPDVQQLIGGVKKPEDAYQAKLFDQYVGKAKEALGAGEGVLLKNINESYKAQLETLYTYILMANVSTEQQGVEIQAIKDAEAAEAARKAAAEARAGYDTTAESQAFKNLIEREGDPAKKRAFYIFNFLVSTAGFTPVQAAGILGNLSVESASTFDPSVDQSNYGGGNAKGIAQWEGPRWTRLQEFAASRGTAWNDMDTQLAFLNHELPGRRDTLNVIKATDSIYHSAREFMIRFETPRVVVDAMNTGAWGKADAQAQKRAERGQPFLDALIAETQKVNAEREAAAKAEAERVAKMGLNLEQSLAFMKRYTDNPDNVQYIGGAGTGCEGGPLSNCVSFSVYFINKYTDLKGMKSGAPGNGSGVAGNTINRNPGLASGTTAKPFAIFSVASGSQWCGNVKCGHTGVILGVDEARGVAIVGEAGCSTHGSWDTAREYPLSKFNNGEYTYAYTDGHLTGDINN